jgi:putative transposase
MPGKNIIKEYRSDSFYHIYNRGVNKGDIFLSKFDYQSFLSFLKIYLSPKNTKELQQSLEIAVGWQEKDKIIRLLRLNNFSQEISLLAYCLMPNHFHLLIKQSTSIAIQSFIRSLLSKYSMYFNFIHKRTGPLFEGRYKAVLVKSEEQLVHLSRYIHLNPKEKSSTWKYSSLPNYLGQINQIWVKSNEILSYFSEEKPGFSYKSFIDQKDKDFTLLDKLKLD